MPDAVLVYSPHFADYRLSPTHPLNPVRLVRTFDLIQALGMLEPAGCAWREPAEAPAEELELIHSAEYLEVVRSLEEGRSSPEAWRWGLGTSDNPVFPGIYSGSALCAGGSILAADLVLAGARAAFNIGGGLHHAHRDRAAGFCVFNDPAVGIAHLLRRQPSARVAYLDIDAHHGDGVQEAFYPTNQVLTISLHESGEWLFPGTGRVEELGVGEGLGYSVNLPLAPGTGDQTYLWAFEQVAPPLLEAFSPDYVFTQLGIDSHFLDPLTHLCLTVEGYGRVVRRISEMAARWIATGGGGYHLEVVPRAWALAYAIMAGAELPDQLPASLAGLYPGSDGRLLDQRCPEEPDGQARRYAERSVEKVRRLVFPYHGL